MTLELTAKVTVILLAAIVGGLLLRRASAATRHLVHSGALIAALALPLAVAVLPAWELPLLPGAASRATVQPLAQRDPVTLPAALPFDGPIGPTPAADHHPLPAPAVAARKASAPCDCAPVTPATPAAGDDRVLLATAAGPTVPPETSGADIGWAVWLWVGGIALVLGRLAFHWLRMARMAIDATPLEDDRVWRQVHACRQRLGSRSVPRVLIGSGIAAPLVWGVVQPTLLLPRSALGWSTDRLRVVLLHELAHLRRRDGLALLVGRIAAAIWWFHPLVWLVERNARRDCERACDDAVLVSGEKPSRYAEHLLEIAGELPPATTLPAGALALTGPRLLERRLHAILHPNRRRGLGRRGAVLALACLSVALVSVSSARLVARSAAGDTADALATQRPSDAHDARDATPPAVERTAPRAPERSERSTTRATAPTRETPAYLLAHDGAHDDGERLFDEAFELHNEERFAQAIELFERAAAAGYRPGTALYNAGCGQARLGHAAEAVDAIERAIEAGFRSAHYLEEDSDLDPIRKTRTFRAMMERLADEGTRGNRPRADRYERVVEEYDALRESGSTEGRAWHRVGSALLSLRELDRAIDALGRAADLLGDTKANAAYNLACAHALRGDKRQALNQLERAVLAGFDSDERFANDRDLDAIRDASRFAEIAELHDVLSLDRFRNWDHGRSSYSERRWKPAIAEYSRFVEKHPEIGRAWSNLGWALHHSRRHAEARDAFMRQLELGYREGIATYNVACTYAMEGRTDPALEWLERAVELEAVSADHLFDDEDLTSLHDDPRFEAVVDRAIAQRRAKDKDKDKGSRWKFRFERQQPRQSDVHEY